MKKITKDEVLKAIEQWEEDEGESFEELRNVEDEENAQACINEIEDYLDFLLMIVSVYREYSIDSSDFDCSCIAVGYHSPTLGKYIKYQDNWNAVETTDKEKFAEAIAETENEIREFEERITLN